MWPYLDLQKGHAISMTQACPTANCRRRIWTKLSEKKGKGRDCQWTDSGNYFVVKREPEVGEASFKGKLACPSSWRKVSGHLFRVRTGAAKNWNCSRSAEKREGSHFWLTEVCLCGSVVNIHQWRVSPWQLSIANGFWHLQVARLNG